MRRVALAVALLGQMVGVANAARFLDNSYQSLPPDLVQDVVSAVAMELRDPDSGMFKGLKHPDTGSHVVDSSVICGYVNSKNGYGGYVGFVPFAYEGPIGMTKDPVVIIDEMVPGDDMGNALRKHVMKQSGCAAALGL